MAVLCAALLPAVSACAPAAGGAVLVGFVAIGALTSHCYDYLDVTVFDDQGRKTCAATVSARNGSDHFELSSCYYTPLTDGVWTLTASLPGHVNVTTTVPVEHANDCIRHVQSVELSFSAPGSAPAFASPAAITQPSAAPGFPPPPAPPPAATTPPPAPSAPPLAPSATPPNAPAVPSPANSAVTPVGVFPAQ